MKALFSVVFERIEEGERGEMFVDLLGEGFEFGWLGKVGDLDDCIFVSLIFVYTIIVRNEYTRQTVLKYKN